MFIYWDSPILGVWASLLVSHKKIYLPIQEVGLIPGSGRLTGEGNDNPFQYSCLRNPMNNTLMGCSPWGHKSIGHDLVTKKQQQYWVHIFVVDVSSWIDPLIITQCPSLSLVTVFILKYVCVYIYIYIYTYIHTYKKWALQPILF